MFTPASMEVVPQNSYERVFTIVTILSAIILFSSFLSSISTAVATFRRKHEERVKQNAALIRYMQENHVSLELGSRIQTFIRKHAMQPGQVHRIHTSDVPQLKQLPPFLKEQLACEVYRPVVCGHPFFNSMRNIDSGCVSAICGTAMSQQSVMPEHTVFRFGDNCKSMYFVVGGEMAYFEGGMSSSAKYSMVKAGNWACELALFLAWEHRGLMTTLQAPCELVLIDAGLFLTLLRCWPQAKDLCRRYACLIMKDAQSSLIDVTDIPMTREEVVSFIDQAVELW